MIATATPSIYGWLANWNTTSGAEWHLHAAERCCLWRWRERDEFRHHDHCGQQRSEHLVGIPSNGATVSGSQKLDASASSGVTSVQFEITGGISTMT